jgi:hypothetical protein
MTESGHQLGQCCAGRGGRVAASPRSSACGSTRSTPYLRSGEGHLHRFALGGSPFDRNTEPFLCPYDAEEGEDDGTPAKDVTLEETLTEPGDVLQYCYDYGDSWAVVIVLEAVLPLVESAPVAVCVDGRRPAPPEDCGG